MAGKPGFAVVLLWPSQIPATGTGWIHVPSWNLALLFCGHHGIRINSFLIFTGAQWARSVTEAHSQRSDRCVPSVISFLLVTLDLPAFVSAVNRVWSPGCLQHRGHPPPAAPRPVLVAGGVSTRGAFSFSWHLQLTQPGRV